MNFNDFLLKIDYCCKKRLHWFLIIGFIFIFFLFTSLRASSIKNMYINQPVPVSIIVWHFMIIPAIACLIFFTLENLFRKQYKNSVDNLTGEIVALTANQIRQKIENGFIKEKLDVDENKRLLIVDHKNKLYMVSKGIISELSVKNKKKLYSVDNFNIEENKKDKIKDMLD